MPEPDNSLFATGLSRLSLKGHQYSNDRSPRDFVTRYQREQFPDYDPDAGVAYDLMRRRNPGRKLTPYQKIPQPTVPPSRPFARRGTGIAYVPPRLPVLAEDLGRPSAINHEFEHAFGQSRNTPRSVEEVAPVLGDIVFGAESFRRQAGKPLVGTIPYGYKHQDVEWMRSQAQKHGYFDGRSMTDLLRTPEGISYLRQASLGPKAYADDNGASGEFDPLAPRGDLPLPTKPVQLPPYPIFIPQHILDMPERRKKNRLRGLRIQAELDAPQFEKHSLRNTFPLKDYPRPTVRDNDTRAESGTFVGNSIYHDSRKTASAQEQARKNILQGVRADGTPRLPFVGLGDVTGTQTSNPYLEAHKRVRYPGQNLDTIVPIQQGKSIRDALKKYEDNPMGGYYTPTQSLFPYYRITPELRANMRARHRGLPNGN